ncbi:MAG TPA: septal ring lytic transglycosylase RlpA family protein [Albitalea sp.]|nr:septal ring lytic transglycosylase RlpA family protein [Albitalea sp.]
MQAPRTGAAPSAERDGAEASPPTDLASVPDAEPRVETIRTGGPNKPYEALGRDYVPLVDDRAFAERGLASWYGRKFHGRRTANGEVYNMYAMTAAHPTLPIPSYAKVRNPANGREVVVRINDRGPFHAGRIVDLSYTAALKLDVLRGVTPVELSRITFDEIRTGAWRKGAVPDALPVERAPTELAAVPAGDRPAPALVNVALQEGIAEPRPAKGFWVQLGAFKQRDGADSFHRRVIADVDWLAPLLAIVSEPSAFRLQAGPYASRSEAQAVAARVRGTLQLVPVIVERRE